MRKGLMKMKRVMPLLLVLLLVFCCGCVRQTAVLTEEILQPREEMKTTVLNGTVTTADGWNYDEMGQPVTGEAHYSRYVTFSNLRVYGYNGGTFLDGTCTNSYAMPLTGKVRIAYCDANGTEIAFANLHTVDSDLLALQSGDNRIYAEIYTDMDVNAMDFEMEIQEPFHPNR